MKKNILLLLCVSTSSLFAETVLDGLKLTLNDNVYGIIAEQIKTDHLKDIRSERLPDFERDLGKGIRLEAKGLWYSLDFTNFTLLAVDNAIHVKLEVKNIHLHSDRFDFSKKVVGKTIRSECVNTDLHISRNRALPVKADLFLNVESNLIVSEARNIQFSIPADDYQVDGPRDCSGVLGIGHLIREVIEDLIPRLRPKMESAIHREIQKMGPVVGKMLNEKLIQGFLLDLGESPFITKNKFQIKPIPSKIELLNNQSLFVFNIVISGEESEFDHHLRPALEILDGLAGLQLHPNLFNTVIKQGLNTKSIEINEVIAPKIKKALFRKNLVLVWPELISPFFSENYLKLFVQFTKLPSLQILNGKIEVHFPEIDLLTEANKQKKWKGFFDFKSEVKGSLVINVNEKDVLFSLAEVPTYTLNGDWNPNYRPTLPVYNETIVEKKIASSIQKLKQKNLFSFKNIKVEISNQVFTIDKIVTKNGYFDIQLKANPKP